MLLMTEFRFYLKSMNPSAKTIFNSCQKPGCFQELYQGLSLDSALMKSWEQVGNVIYGESQELQSSPFSKPWLQMKEGSTLHPVAARELNPLRNCGVINSDSP